MFLLVLPVFAEIKSTSLDVATAAIQFWGRTSQRLPDSTNPNSARVMTFTGPEEDERGYWSINISNITDIVTVINVTFGIYIQTHANPSSSFFATWYYCNEFIDGSLTWNNQPAGNTEEIVGGTCNATVLNNITQIDITQTNQYLFVNSSNAINEGFKERVQWEVDNDDGLFSIMSQVTPASSPTRHDYESADINNQPFFNITYDDIPVGPPEIILINLTNGKGEGQIIFNSSGVNIKQVGSVRTNDTTPTFFVITNEAATCCLIDQNADLNWTQCFAGTDNFDTEGLTHILTLNSTNATGRYGLHNFSAGCKDSEGNENITSTSGKFLVNITNPFPPVIDASNTGKLLINDFNNSNATITWSATSVSDTSFTVTVDINNTPPIYTNTTFGNASTSTIFFSRDIGIYNISINVTDRFNNKNSTGILITVRNDSVAPSLTITDIEDGVFFRVDVNNTDILFNWSCSDANKTYTARQYIDSSLEYDNTTYTNGTNILFTKTVAVGSHTWSANCTDPYNNQGSEKRDFTVEQEETVDVFLDLISADRKYEYRSIVNISANCTEKFAGTCQVEIDLIAPDYGFNFSFGDNFTSFLFNITTLRKINFSNGPSSVTLSASDTLNITSDNRTSMTSVSLDVTSSGTTTNLNITYFDRVISFAENIRTKYLEQNQFIESNSLKTAVNLTYLTAGSNFIFSNLTDIQNPINISFQIRGFDLDTNNEFSYTDNFNRTTNKGYNDTLSFHTDAPLGFFDNFNSNNSDRWTLDADVNGPTILNMTWITLGDEKAFYSISTVGLSASGNRHIKINYDYSDSIADFRNTSIIEFLSYHDVSATSGVNSGRSQIFYYVTDGTNKVELKTYIEGDGTKLDTNNYTLIRKTDDYKTWELLINGTSDGNKDLSTLDFTKQIKLSFRTEVTQSGTGGGVPSGATAVFVLYNIKWGGVMLNMSTTNGTYRPRGNITSNVLNVTQNNISIATLTASDFRPDNTQIDYYLSNTCNNTNPIFESVVSGISHVFDSVGNEICWRATLNSSVNTSSPIVRKVQIDIVKATAENITVAIEDNIQFTFNGILNSTNSPQLVNLTPTGSQLNTIKISTTTGGVIQVDNFKLNASINPITLNKTLFEDCSNCVIDFSFSGDDIIVNDLKFDFLGSWNYTAIARAGTNRVERLIQVFYSDFNISLPKNIDWYDVLPSSKDSKNITPEGQDSNTPIWNITGKAYDEPFDVYVKTNESIDDCINVTFTNNSMKELSTANESFTWVNDTAVLLANLNIIQGTETIFNQSSGDAIGSNNYTMNYTEGTITLISNFENNKIVGINYSYNVYGYDLSQSQTFILNLSYQKIIPNISKTNTITWKDGTWNWWSLYNCSAGMILPYFDFASHCSACVFNEEQLDLFNVIRQ